MGDSLDVGFIPLLLLLLPFFLISAGSGWRFFHGMGSLLGMGLGWLVAYIYGLIGLEGKAWLGKTVGL